MNDVISSGRLAIQNVDEMKEVEDLTHGSIYPLFLNSIKSILRLSDSRDVILIRRLCNFLVFWMGAFFFYHLCRYYFADWRIGLLGSLLLVAHPRIFADAFFNTMDIPFLSAYIISAWTLLRFLDKMTYRNALLHALSCAILIDIRVIGLVMPLCTGVFVATMPLGFGRIKKNKIDFAPLAAYAVSFIFLLILFWPLLWESPVIKFLHSLSASQYEPEKATPWYYNPKWIIVTTPLPYTLFFFVGLMSSLPGIFGRGNQNLSRFCVGANSFSRPGQGQAWQEEAGNGVRINSHPNRLGGDYPRKRDIQVAFFLFFVPLILPVIFRTRLFDGWRHHYFVYPILLLFSLSGLIALWKTGAALGQNVERIVHAVIVLVLGIGLIGSIWFMIRYHPHQYAYANILAGRNKDAAKYENALDYWGLSYRQALEHILETDRSGVVRVAVANPPGKNNAYILPYDEFRRLIFVDDPNEANYLLTNYRSNYRFPWREYPRGEFFKHKYYSIEVGGVEMMGVYKLDK
ncbi:glycosyltransferase family 39 protein [Candidatus Poribacteria bacterium]|nr:glycosyltransferase family 39 protein [Candidatus Poribacteria bacterium]